MWPICTKPVLRWKIQFQGIEQKLDESHLRQLLLHIDHNSFNIFILYKEHKSLNKRNLDGYYLDDFVEVMIIKSLVFLPGLRPGS